MLLLLVVTLAGFRIEVGESIGVCYGRLGDNLPSERDVVDLYKSNNIGQIRLYAPDQSVLNALRGSNLDVLLGVPNSDLAALASDASAWVQNNVRAFYPDVKIKYIAVGNEVKPGDAQAGSVLPAMQKVHDALAAAGLQDQIKVSTAVEMGLLGNSYPPEAGEFSADAKPYVSPIVQFLVDHGSPLLANVYPYFAHIYDKKNVPLDYALLVTPNSNYKNMLAAMVDAVYAALDKVGGGGLRIVLSESGWPSDGGDAASHDNAQTYLRNLVEKVKGGTARKPEPIETYVFAMFDENQKPGAESEKHFGLFFPDKQPKYQISFS